MGKGLLRLSLVLAAERKAVLGLLCKLAGLQAALPSCTMAPILLTLFPDYQETNPAAQFTFPSPTFSFSHNAPK